MVADILLDLCSALWLALVAAVLGLLVLLCVLGGVTLTRAIAYQVEQIGSIEPISSSQLQPGEATPDGFVYLGPAPPEG